MVTYFEDLIEKGTFSMVNNKIAVQMASGAISALRQMIRCVTNSEIPKLPSIQNFVSSASKYINVGFFTFKFLMCDFFYNLKIDMYSNSLLSTVG